MPNSNKYDTALIANVSIEYGGGKNKQKKMCGGESLQKTIVHNSKFCLIGNQKITKATKISFFKYYIVLLCFFGLLMHFDITQ